MKCGPRSTSRTGRARHKKPTAASWDKMVLMHTHRAQRTPSTTSTCGGSLLDKSPHTNVEATCSYGTAFPTCCPLHSPQPGSQVEANLKPPAMKIQTRDELFHLLILGVCSHACRCDMTQSTKNRDLSRQKIKHTFSPHPLLLVILPSPFTIPIGMDAVAAMTTNQRFDQRHVLHCLGSRL